MNKSSTNKSILKTLLWVLAVLIIVLLIIIMAVPSISIFSSRGRGEGIVFGKFANRKIVFGQDTHMSRALAQIEEQYRRGLDPSLYSFMQMYIWQQAYQASVDYEGLGYYADKTGVIVTEEEVNDYIRSIVVDEEGEFSEESWARFTDAERASIRRDVEQDIKRSRIIDAVILAPITSGEVETLKNFNPTESQDLAEGEEKVEKTTEGVIATIRGNSQQLVFSSIRQSELLEDDFVEVYNREIQPQLAEPTLPLEVGEPSSEMEAAESDPVEITVDEVED